MKKIAYDSIDFQVFIAYTTVLESLETKLSEDVIFKC
jgi:hypothetical protein